jgi:protein TonB
MPDLPARPDPDRMAATPPAETVSAVEEDGPAPRSSLRPPTRPESAQRLPPPDPEPRVSETRQPAATGNAATDATRGNDQGTQTGTAAASAPRRTDTRPAADPAEVANYPGEVLRRIARQGRPRVRHDGADAVIAFSIDASGALASLAVARSSGNATLDEAGLTILRRAAPFPPPPRGAQTRFSIAFGGR